MSPSLPKLNVGHVRHLPPVHSGGNPTQPTQRLTAALASQPTPALFDLSNRTILVTGGARGLGLTIAHALVESGADVIAFDLLEPVEPEWSAAQAAATTAGVTLSFAHLDITNAEAVEAAVAASFAAARRPVRGMFHAARVQLMRGATEYTPAEFRRIVDIDLTGSYLMCAAFARNFFKDNGDYAVGKRMGSIALVASMSGRVANAGLECAAYNAAKAGCIQLAKNLAMEWGGKGIRVNTLSPGYIRTKLTDDLLEQQPALAAVWLKGSLIGRLSTPDEFRGPAVFLLSDASSFMTGSDLVVDGGHTAT